MATFAEIKNQIKPGVIIAYRSYSWTTRRSAIKVEAVDNLTRTTLVSGRKYLLGSGVVSSKSASALVFPDTEVEIIESRGN